MKTSAAWIKTYLQNDKLEHEEIIDALGRAGMEIDDERFFGELDENIVVAKIEAVSAHPNADRLHVTQVNDGTRVYEVVCGAPNVRVGLYAPFAREGAKLPGGEVIGPTKLRGVVSNGMLCSPSELQVADDHNGLLELASNLDLGTPLRQIYPADIVADLKTPANRFDVQSIYGLSREVAAFTGVTLDDLKLAHLDNIWPARQMIAEVSVAAPHYMLAKIEVARQFDLPTYIGQRLRSGGMRCVSSLVDITNYVMLETGQPLHAFDADKVRLPIQVRNAVKGETLVTLDGQSRKLDPEDLVIADERGPIALAGVMGGADTEVSETTQTILLEAAAFEAAMVRKSAKRHGLRSEASGRMERGVPTELPPVGLARAVQLLAEHGKAKLEHVEEVLEKGKESHKIELTGVHLEKIAGYNLDLAEGKKALGRLGISAVKAKDRLIVQEVPWWRPDLTIAEDLIEEIIRITGYDQVPIRLPEWRPRSIQFDKVRAKKRQVREALYGLGCFEVMTYSFLSERQLKLFGLDPKMHMRLQNPRSVDQAYLRTTLLPSHVAVLAANRMFAKNIQFYEISRVYYPTAPGELPDEPEMLAITVLSQGDALAHARGIVEVIARLLGFKVQYRPEQAVGFTSGRSAAILLGNERLGSIGLIDNTITTESKLKGYVAFIEIDFNIAVKNSTITQYNPTSKFPKIERDITFSVPTETMWADIEEAVRDEAVEFVSEYRPEDTNSRNITIRLTVSDKQKTPTEQDAESAEKRIMKKLNSVLRG